MIVSGAAGRGRGGRGTLRVAGLRLGGRLRLGLLAVAGRAALAGVLLCLGRLLVRVAAVVGFVEARALEQDGRPRAEQAAQALLAALRTDLQRLVLERLELV